MADQVSSFFSIYSIVSLVASIIALLHAIAMILAGNTNYGPFVFFAIAYFILMITGFHLSNFGHSAAKAPKRTKNEAAIIGTIIVVSNSISFILLVFSRLGS